MDHIPDVPFAHTIEPTSVDFLADLVSPEEWEKSKDEMYRLAQFRHPAGGGATYYVLFLDPTNRTLGHVTDADTLYHKYETKFYNEEIHLITPKK